MTTSTPLRASLIAALAGAALAASAQNIVQDPGFESAIAAPASGAYSLGDTFDGGNWFLGLSPDGTLDSFQVDQDPRFVISGTTSTFMSGASVFQTLTTVPSMAYTVSFDAYSFLSSAPLTLSFGSTTLTANVPQASGLNPPTNIGHFSFVLTATAASTVLSLGNSSTSLIELDNVSVVPQAIPEPSSIAAFGLSALLILRRRRR